MSTTRTRPVQGRPVGGAPRVYVAQVMFLILLVGGLMVPGAIGIWFHVTPNTVTATADAGQFESASRSDDVTNILTTVGTIAVSGTLSAPRWRTLIIQRSTKRGPELCASGAANTCVALEAPWAGSMREVPGSQEAFDFFDHGITSYSLNVWLMFGLAMTFFCGIAACVEFVDNHPEFIQMERG